MTGPKTTRDEQLVYLGKLKATLEQLNDLHMKVDILIEEEIERLDPEAFKEMREEIKETLTEATARPSAGFPIYKEEGGALLG